MEQPHLSSQIDYLEQKYLESQERVAKLQQQTEAQEYKLQEQARRIEKLEEQLAEAYTQITRIPQFDEQLDHFKSELLQTIEQQHSGHRHQKAVDPGHTLAAQLDTHTKTLHELRRELDKTHRYDEQIALTRTEVERLNKAVGTFQAQLSRLNEQLDERTRAASYLDEQRRVDAHRLAELQAELSPLQQKIEANLSKIQMVEQQIPQFGKYEIALEEMREEIRRHREHMDFQVAQRERQIKQWTELIQTQERRMEEYESLAEKYAQHYQLSKRALTTLQDFQERLQREQHQSAELQRLSEDRQRTAIEKWQADYEQRWQKQMVEWKPMFVDLQKNLDILKKQMNEREKFNQTIEKQINMILQIVEEDIQARAIAVQEWQQRFEELANEQD